MKDAAKDLDFERASELRDILFELKAERWLRWKTNPSS
jgi:excinuclease ABC subunit B